MLDKSNLTFDYRAIPDSPQTITVYSNAEWSVSENVDWVEAVKVGTDIINISVILENTTATEKTATITVTASADSGNAVKEITVTQLDKVTSCFNTINEDGTLSAKSSSEYNHMLATWAMELSYAAYNYPDGTELPSIPGAFMGDVNYTAADVLRSLGFDDDNIIEENYTKTDCGAYTIAYRDIEYAVAENTNNAEERTDENDNLSVYRTDVSGTLHASVYTGSSSTRSSGSDIQITVNETDSIRPLVVVAMQR